MYTKIFNEIQIKENRLFNKVLDFISQDNYKSYLQDEKFDKIIQEIHTHLNELIMTLENQNPEEDEYYFLFDTIHYWEVFLKINFNDYSSWEIPDFKEPIKKPKTQIHYSIESRLFGGISNVDSLINENRDSKKNVAHLYLKLKESFSINKGK